jgi:hypothetical protein
MQSRQQIESHRESNSSAINFVATKTNQTLSISEELMHIVVNLIKRAGIRSSFIVLLFPALISMSMNAASLFAGDSYAFLVGVKQYDKKQFNPLKFSEDDVTVLAEQLQKVGFKKDNIVLMTQSTGAQTIDLLPTRDRIGTQFNTLLKELQPEDTLLVVFSGHGVQFKEDSSQYFCPADAQLENKNSLISIKGIYSALSNSAKCRAKNKLLIVDACRNEPISAAGKSAKGVDLHAIGVDRKAPPQGLAAIYSCSQNEISWEHPDLKHGVFLYHVIQAFGGQGDLDKDGELSLQELTQYTVKNTQRFVRKEFNLPQTPETFVEGKGLMTLAKISSSRSFEPSNETIPKTDIYNEDFRSVENESIPEGWVNLKTDNEAFLLVNQQQRPFLRSVPKGTTFTGGRSAPGAIRMQPLRFVGDFFIELTVLSNESWYKSRLLVLNLKNRDDEKISVRCFEDTTGFIAVLPGSEESMPFSLSGRTPYKLKIERESGKYRVVVNAKTILEHDSKDHREFDVCELELSPNVNVGSVKIGPLLPDSPKPATKPPATTKKTSGR